jgi:hypothetical protein
MLLDNRAHIVLIHTDLVTRLCLHRRLLPEPETIDVAVKSAKSLSQMTLTKWVKLSVTSQDGQWTSCTVRALVTLHLCTSVILGLPLEIISDCDKLFMLKFWTALHKLTGMKLKMSSLYHPQTDGASKQTNKTVKQALRYHVAQNQKDGNEHCHVYVLIS